MARRKGGDGLLDLLVRLPWWLTLAVSVCLFVYLKGRPLSVDSLKPETLKPMLLFGGLHVLKWACLAAAFVSGMLTLKRKLLFASAKGIETIRAMSWCEFESLVGEAYRRQGYLIKETGGGGADGGVDVLLHGKGQKVFVQCKQWRTNQVGVSVVREMYGVMVGEHADRVVIVASGSYTKDACAFARGKPIELIDGKALVRLIRDVKGEPVAVQPAASAPPAQTAPQKVLNVQTAGPADVAPSCPKCGAPMVLRTARKGANAGNSFWGCSRYPACKGIVNV